MTIEELLKLPASGLEAMTDEQLSKELMPYFKFCRPGEVAVQKNKILESSVIPRPQKRAASPASKGGQKTDILLYMLQNKAKQLGIKI